MMALAMLLTVAGCGGSNNTASTASDAVKNSSKQGSEAISSKMKYMGR